MSDEKRVAETNGTLGQPIRPDIELEDAYGEQVGRVIEVQRGFVVAEDERRVYYIPREQITKRDDGDWLVLIDKSILSSLGWMHQPKEPSQG